MKKAFVWDYNNILLDVEDRIETTRNPHEADIAILWQDVRGGCYELAKIFKEYYGRPVVVVQHGRGATRDYNEPNNFPLIADKICVWGSREAERIEKQSYKNRAVITGSPLLHHLRHMPARVDVDKKVIVFTPIIASHEEPDNLEVFYELKRIEYENAKRVLKENKDVLKAAWHSWQLDPTYATENQIPYDLLRKNFFLVSKLTTVHDAPLYHGVTVKTNVMNATHMRNNKILLANCDCIVGLEEGTFQLMATFLGIPTVIVNGFKYGKFGGVSNYDRCEVIHSKATAFCDLKDLEKTIEHEIEHKERRKLDRERVIIDEFDPYPDKDPIELIIDVASELCGGNLRKGN